MFLKVCLLIHIGPIFLIFESKIPLNQSSKDLLTRLLLQSATRWRTSGTSGMTGSTVSRSAATSAYRSSRSLDTDRKPSRPVYPQVRVILLEERDIFTFSSQSESVCVCDSVIMGLTGYFITFNIWCLESGDCPGKHIPAVPFPTR